MASASSNAPRSPSRPRAVATERAISMKLASGQTEAVAGLESALVRADGAIMLGDKVGSIHRIGAVAQGSGACNGWTFWHIETNKGLRLIDELRAEIRSGMAVILWAMSLSRWTSMPVSPSRMVWSRSSSSGAPSRAKRMYQIPVTRTTSSKLVTPSVSLRSAD